MKYKLVRFILPLCYYAYVINEIYFLLTYDYNASILRLPLERLDINLAKIIFSLVIAESIRKQIVDKLYIVSLMGISTTLLVDKLFSMTGNGSILDLLEFVEIISVLLLIFFVVNMLRKNKFKNYKSILKISFVSFTSYWFLSKIIVTIFHHFFME